MRIESSIPYSQSRYAERTREDGIGLARKNGSEDRSERIEDPSGQRGISSGQTGESQLSEEEKKEVAELKKADREIKQHEMAHLSASAGLSVSGAQFEYKRGPDGVMYAVAGEVNIDTSPVPGDPQATLAKAQKIERAALAPVDPSPQDRKVAAQARQMAAQARMEMMKESQDAGESGFSTGTTDSEPPAPGSMVDIQA